MGQLAPDKRGRTPRRDGRALTRRARARLTRSRAAVACALLCLLALSAPGLSALAQSGRNKGPKPAEQRRERGPVAEPPKRDAGARPSKVAARAGVEADGEEVDEDDVVRVGTNLVPLPAFVIDAQGRVVRDLQLKDFELVVDGAVRPIGEVTLADSPANVVLLFDNSGSLNAARAFQKAAAARFFQTALRPVDRAAVYSISSVPELAHPLTNNFGALVRTVESFRKPEGATAFFDTVAAAADYLKQTAGRRVIIVVTDGTDTNSDLDFDTTLSRLLATHCQVYAVRVGHSDNANLRDLAGERRLQEFAAQTGGAVYAPVTRADYESAFQQIAADLRQQYVLSYYPPTDQRDGRFHAFDLRVTTRPGLRVRTRKGFYAPNQ
jgi:Ca-activated chloride channel family protein